MKTYVNFRGTAIDFDSGTRIIRMFRTGKGEVVAGARMAEVNIHGVDYTSADFREARCAVEELHDASKLIVYYAGGPAAIPEVKVSFLVKPDGVDATVECRQDAAIGFDGHLLWGKDPAKDTFAACLSKNSGDLRTASGPAASALDNALYDRRTDSAVEFRGGQFFRLAYDWDKSSYRFVLNTGATTVVRRFSIVFHEQFYASKFKVPFAPIGTRTQFPTPPVGWMTWYAVKFKASESTVLENAAWMREHFGDFGANVVWVDWEWYHTRIRSVDEHADIDTFHPNKRVYPKGLGYVSQEIKKLGLVPALWIGATNDVNKNAHLQKHPEWILSEQPEWCGRFWLDLSNPEVVKEYIPTIFRMMMEWGYDVFKWDCLPITLKILDQHHDKLMHPEKSTEEVLRAIVASARDTIGPDRYMMSCSGHGIRDIAFASDLFDGARVGGDVFSWDDYVKEGIERVCHYLCFNNVLFYSDLDNIILRGEFNNQDQARSRASLLGLIGMPVTMGDNLPELEADRVEYLKRIIPVLDMHPMDLEKHSAELNMVVANLSIARSFENWNVVDIFNPSAQARTMELDLYADLHLDTANGQSYALYDFWNKRYLGAYQGRCLVELAPYASQVLAVRLIQDRPQLLSTSRHISQGGLELKQLAWDEERLVLRGVSALTAKDPYEMAFLVPPSYEPKAFTSKLPSGTKKNADGTVSYTLTADTNYTLEWELAFRKAT